MCSLLFDYYTPLWEIRQVVANLRFTPLLPTAMNFRAVGNMAVDLAPQLPESLPGLMQGILVGRVGSTTCLPIRPKAEPRIFGLLHHPRESAVRKPPLQIAAAKVAVNAREPYLPHGLTVPIPVFVPDAGQELSPLLVN